MKINISIQHISRNIEDNKNNNNNIKSLQQKQNIEIL